MTFSLSIWGNGFPYMISSVAKQSNHVLQTNTKTLKRQYTDTNNGHTHDPHNTVKITTVVIWVTGLYIYQWRGNTRWRSSPCTVSSLTTRCDATTKEDYPFLCKFPCPWKGAGCRTLVLETHFTPIMKRTLSYCHERQLILFEDNYWRSKWIMSTGISLFNEGNFSHNILMSEGKSLFLLVPMHENIQWQEL